MQIVFKSKARLDNSSYFQRSYVWCRSKFQCGLCNESYYGECIKHFHVKNGEHIGISPLTRKQGKPKNSSLADNLLFLLFTIWFY